MVCPFCLHRKTEVYNSRSTSGDTVVWRRRRCAHCKKTFTTEESFDPTNIWQVSGSAKTIPYSRPRLTQSIIKACDHRSDATPAVWYLFESIERQLLPIAAANESIITTQDITATTAAILKNFDAAAYVKYISYHQPPLDAQSLRKQLRKKA